MQVLTACQVRAARAMLRMSVRELAKESGVSDSTIRRIERTFGVPDGVSVEVMANLHRFFDARGFEFQWDDGVPGLKWVGYTGKRPDAA